MQDVSDRADLRAIAIERLKKKREFWQHLFVFVVVNSVIVGIWAATGSGFFWPVFPILGWGIGLVFHAWDVFTTPRISEERIEREIDRLR